MIAKSVAISVLLSLLLSGCVSKINTEPNRQFLQDANTANGLYINYGQEINDTWNAYVDNRLTEQQTIDFVHSIQSVERRETVIVATLGNNLPQPLPGSNYPKIITDLQTSASMVDNMCSLILAYFNDNDRAHINEAQKNMIRLGVWVQRVNSDISNEIDVLNTYEAAK